MSFVALSIGDVHVSERLTVSFVREDDADDQSALSNQLTIRDTFPPWKIMLVPRNIACVL